MAYKIDANETNVLNLLLQVTRVQIKPHFGLVTTSNFGLKRVLLKKNYDLSKLPL